LITKTLVSRKTALSKALNCEKVNIP